MLICKVIFLLVSLNFKNNVLSRIEYACVFNNYLYFINEHGTYITLTFYWSNLLKLQKTYLLSFNIFNNFFALQ